MPPRNTAIHNPMGEARNGQSKKKECTPDPAKYVWAENEKRNPHRSTSLRTTLLGVGGLIRTGTHSVSFVGNFRSYASESVSTRSLGLLCAVEIFVSPGV